MTLHAVRSALVLVIVSSLLAAADQPAAEEDPGGGVVITLGPTDGAREAALLEKGRCIVAHITTPGEEAARLRERVAAQGLGGAITVVETVEPGRLPFLDDLVALAVVEGTNPPTDQELLRVLRPRGVARIRTGSGWRRLTKPWPTDYGHWGHYQYDASFNEVTPDRTVGLPAGFQWISDPPAVTADRLGVRVLDGVLVVIEPTAPRARDARIVARDAFSGIELWSVPAPAGKARTRGVAFSQYGFIAAEGRVYVHAFGERFAKSLELATGRLLTTYDQGLELPTEWDKKEEGGLFGRTELRRDLVHRGVLIQVHGPTICALDFASGRPLWRVVHPEGRGWDRPAAADGMLVVAEGSGPGLDRPLKQLGYIRSSSIECAALVGITIADGRQAWRTPLPSPMTPLDNCIRGGRYFLSLAKTPAPGQGTTPDKEIPTLSVALQNGEVQWQRSMRWSGGHPPHLMATADRVWQTSHAGGTGLALDGKGELVARTDQIPGREVAFWGCNTTWMSERFFFSRLSVTEVETGRHRYNTAVRSSCVFGTTPACGLLYSTPHVCGCWGVVNGYNAVHSRDMRPLRTPWPGKRLLAGTAKPSPVPGQRPAADEWPIYLRDSARSNWVDTELSKQPGVAWTVAAPASSKAPAWLQAQWMRAIHRVGPVTAVTVAEGILAGACTDQHTLFALDAATGAPRWRRQLDSAIDSPPTIDRGSVYVGTRGGWVWALARDTGEVLWRFLATPHQRLMVVNGQFEAVWPLFGTVALHDGRLWVTAGRHVELDEGIFWWSLDPASGAVRSSGRLHDDDGWFTKGTSRVGWDRPVGINSPLVMKDDFAIVSPTAFKPSDGSLLKPFKDYAATQYDTRMSYLTPTILPGMYGLVYDGVTAAGRQGPHMVYGGIGARMIAYRGDDFIGTNSGRSDARGGGGALLARWRRRPASETLKHFNDLSEMRWSHRPPMEGGDQGIDTSTSVLVAGGTVAAAVTYRGRGSVLLHRYDDGAELAKLPMNAIVVFGGLAAAKGTLYAVLRDGTIVALR